MPTAPYYKLWIYSINIAIIALELSFLVGLALLINRPALGLLPVHSLSKCMVATLVLLIIQLCVSTLGIWAVWTSHKRCIRWYWYISVPLVVADTLLAGMWAASFQHMHHDAKSLSSLNIFNASTLPAALHTGLLYSVPSKISREKCIEWEWFMLEYGCRPPRVVAESCAEEVERKLGSNKYCLAVLLRWFHTRVDILAFLLYFVTYSLRLVAVTVQCDDIVELTSEIHYTGNRQRYRHWALKGESDDEGTIEDYSSTSRPSSLYQKQWEGKGDVRGLFSFFAG